MDIQKAIDIVETYLVKQEEKLNGFGSALPGYQNPNIKLKVISDKIEEYEFWWLFYYNSAKFVETGDFRMTLGGNAPVIVNKVTGELIVTGTAREPSYYVRNYINTGNPHSEI